MKVLIDARESGTSTGRYIDKLIEHLNKLKPDIEMVLLAKSHRRDYLKKIAPSFKIIRCNIPEFSFAEQYSFVWQLYGIKNDAVHFGMTQQPVLYFGKSITTIHDLTTTRFRNPAKNRLVFAIKQMVYKWVIKRVAKKSIYIITASQYVKDDIIQYTGVDPGKIIVIYEAADKITDKAEPVHGLAKKKFIMYVGRAQPHKNLGRLIEAFKEAQQSQPDLKLVLAGKKDLLYQRLEKKVQKDNLDGVIFTDFVSEGQLRWLYENCQAYVFPSLSEGFGLPALEAMAHGAPVISSNATCLPEIYGNAALYFNPENTGDMAAKILEMLGNDKLRQKLIGAGRTQSAKYSWERMAKQTLEIYKKASDKNT